MKLIASAALITAAAFLATAGATQAQAQSFDQEQTRDIEQIVREYLMQNPDVLIDALREYERRQQAEQQNQRLHALAGLDSFIESIPPEDIVGNPDGDVTIVEFFDYRCGFCHKMMEPILTAIEQDPDLRLVLVEFPILSEASRYAAQAALASREQGLYPEFHFALMEQRGQLNEERVMQIAQSVGLNVEQLRRDMQSPAVEETLNANFALAQQLGVNGTPAFVIGDSFVPGAIPLERLQALVEEARAQGS